MIEVERVREALAAAPEATGRSHDYSRNIWGRAVYHQSHDGGLTITGHLFAPSLSGPELGDWLVLPSGNRTTRYRVTGIRWMGDPDDMWEFSAVFDPRSAPAAAGSDG